MKFNIERTEKYTIFRVEEEKMDSQIAPQVKAEIVNIYQAGILNLIIDMHHVKYVDSSGLSALLMAKRMADSIKGAFIIARPTDHVQKLIGISKLDQVMSILPTLEEASDAVFMADLEREINAGNDNGTGKGSGL